jgi:uncharacterized damage-inducible protein DinB
MKTVDDFLIHLRRERAWTRALFAAVPEEHAGWSPGPEEFSCLGLLRHLMQAEVFWRRLLVAGSRGEAFDPFRLPGTLRERVEAFRAPNVQSSRSERYGTSIAACLESWQEIQAATERELAAIPAEQFASARTSQPLSGMTATIWELALVMMSHEGHHRGQLSAYLKVLGVPQPPILGADPDAEAR